METWASCSGKLSQQLYISNYNVKKSNVHKCLFSLFTKVKLCHKCNLG